MDYVSARELAKLPQNKQERTYRLAKKMAEQALKHLSYFSLKGWNVIFCREPNPDNIYTEIIMDEFVTHSDNVLPGNMGS